MKFPVFFLYLFIVFSAFGARAQNLVYSDDKDERLFVIVTASYNNKEWYKWNLDSVFKQKYQNWILVYVDDCSPDGTGQLVEEYVRERGFEHKVRLIRNTTRCKALANLNTAIHMCNERAVVVILDGDDALSHESVLSYLNKVYQDPNVWLTYGQYQEWPSKEKGFCRQMPKWVVKRGTYRRYPHGPSHLRTFYAGLFQKIKKEDLMYNGDFFAMTYDLAIMYPMMEMAAERFKFIPEVLLDYNTLNPISDHRVSQDLQRDLDHVIRQMPPYKRLEYLFDEDA